MKKNTSPAKTAPQPAAKKPRKEHARDLDKKAKRPTAQELARMKCVHALLEKRRRKGGGFGKDSEMAYTVASLLKEVNGQLHEEFGECSDKTLRRTLTNMQELHGMPLLFDKQENSWRYTEKAEFPWADLDLAVGAGEGEALAILLAQRALPQFAGTPIHEPLGKILLGLEQQLKAGHRQAAEAITGHIRFTGTAATGRDAIPREVWDALHVAFDEQTSVDITYHTAGTGKTAARRVDPYALFVLNNKWNLLAFDHASREVRTFLATRIRDIASTDDRFTPQPGFRIDDYLADTVFGYPTTGKKERVALRFSKETAAAGKDTAWHRQQAQTTDAEGRLTVAFETSALHMVKREVMAWGGGIEVLEPAKLRQEVAEAAAKMAVVNAAR